MSLDQCWSGHAVVGHDFAGVVGDGLVVVGVVGQTVELSVQIVGQWSRHSPGAVVGRRLASIVPLVEQLVPFAVEAVLVVVEFVELGQCRCPLVVAVGRTR